MPFFHFPASFRTRTVIETVCQVTLLTVMWIGASETVSKLAEPRKGDTEVQLTNNHVGRGFSRDTRLILYASNTSGSPLCLPNVSRLKPRPTNLSFETASSAATHMICWFRIMDIRIRFRNLPHSLDNASRKIVVENQPSIEKLIMVAIETE